MQARNRKMERPHWTGQAAQLELSFVPGQPVLVDHQVNDIRRNYSFAAMPISSRSNWSTVAL